MANNGPILLAATVGVVGLVYLATKTSAATPPPPPPGQTPTTLTLSATATNVTVNQSDTVTAKLLDQSNNPIAGYTLTLNGDGTLTAVTDSTGTATWVIAFSAPGTYPIYASG